MIRSRAEWLDLLREVGPEHQIHDAPEHVWRMAEESVALSRSLGLLRAGDRVVDVGCGIGRMAILLAGQAIDYLGIDPNRHSVDLASRLFAPWPRIRFEHADVYNPVYNPSGKLDPRSWRFPVEPGTADFVIFASVFSHSSLLEVCEHYLKEALRILRPGGACGCTWFRSPPNEPSDDPNRTVFLEADIVNAIRPFRVLHSEGGASDAYHDQWILMLEAP